MLSMITLLTLSAHAQDTPEQAALDALINGIEFSNTSAASNRSGGVPPLVTDTLELLAEIAYERARSESYEIIHEELRRLICDEFQIPDEDDFSFDMHYTIGNREVYGNVTLPKGQILPKTCELISNTHDIVTLANAAGDLGRAVEADLLSYGSRIAAELFISGGAFEDNPWQQAQVEAILHAMLQTFSDNVIDGEPPDINDARQLFITLARHNWTKGASSANEKALGTGLKISFAILGKCLKQANTEDTCDAADIADAFSYPISELTGTKGLIPGLEQLSATVLSGVERNAEAITAAGYIQELKKPGYILRASKHTEMLIFVRGLEETDKTKIATIAKVLGQLETMPVLPDETVNADSQSVVVQVSQLFPEAVSDPEVLAAYNALRPYLEALVADCVQLFASRRGTEQLQTEQGFEIAMDVLQLVVQLDELAEGKLPSETWLDPQDVLSRYRKLVLSLIKQDLPAATLEGLELVQLITDAALPDERNFNDAIDAQIAPLKALQDQLKQRTPDLTTLSEVDRQGLLEIWTVRSELLSEPSEMMTGHVETLMKLAGLKKAPDDELKAALDAFTDAYSTLSEEDDEDKKVRTPGPWVTEQLKSLRGSKRNPGKHLDEGLRQNLVQRWQDRIDALEEERKKLKESDEEQIAALEKERKKREEELASIQAAELEDSLIQVYRGVNRTIPVVRVLASNAQSLSQSDVEPEQTETLRSARKETLEALIDASTDREFRDGRWIASLGANVGGHVNIVEPCVDESGEDCTKRIFSDDALSSYNPLTLPMGVAVQRMPDRGAWAQPELRRWGWNGFHTQLSVVDLAQFLPDPDATDADVAAELEWSDFLLIGGQAGWLIGRPDRLLSIGVDARYVPYDDSQLRVGVYASYYVPFFDFN
jgi:hypothetical protein